MRIDLVVSLIFFWFIFSFSSLYAVGLGLALPIGFGTTDYEQYKADAINGGINFVFDNNVAKRSIFNYRLNFGIEFCNHDYSYEISYYDPYSDSYYNQQYNKDRVVIRIVTDHSLGFGIIRSSSIRLWMGPCLRIGFSYIPWDESGYTYGAGITPLGINFNMGEVFTLGLEIGYLYNVDSYSNPIEYNEDGNISSGINNMVVFKLSILFRIRDRYDIF
jgi:hypothetical protein